MWQYHIPENIFFWKFKVITRPSPRWQLDSTGPGIYPQIYQSYLTIKNLFLHPPRKYLLLPLSLSKNRIYLDIHFKGELTDLLWKLQFAPYSHKQSRKRIINCIIMLNITPACNT